MVRNNDKVVASTRRKIKAGLNAGVAGSGRASIFRKESENEGYTNVNFAVDNWIFFSIVLLAISKSRKCRNRMQGTQN